MIKVEHIDVWGFEHAVRGLRNPMSSWDKSDSGYGCNGKLCGECAFKPYYCEYTQEFVIGKDDLGLMKRLYGASLDGDNHAHRKYLRQIFVSMDITAPDYYFKELDTYKIGVVENSTSTMHRLHSKPIARDDFSIDEYGEEFERLIADCEKLRVQYVETKDITTWRKLIQLLPMSYNYRRTVTMNYENVVTIIHQRTGHRLSEWNDFVKVLQSLPYIEEIIKEDAGNE